VPLRAYGITARLGRAFGRLQAWHEVDRLVQLEQQGLLRIGRHSYGRPRVDVYRGSEARVEIGAFCSIGPDVRIVTGGVHPPDRVSTFPFRVKMGLPGAYADGVPSTDGDVTIGPDVWVGTGVTILSGVTVGAGAVIATGAVVTRDVEPYAVVAGIPARMVRHRFTPVQVEALLRIRWWDWPDDVIRTRVDDLSGGTVEAFIERYDRPGAGSGGAGRAG
jgi:acetyltransferase-like isoleucine patch superfamily enzyme